MQFNKQEEHPIRFGYFCPYLGQMDASNGAGATFTESQKRAGFVAAMARLDKYCVLIIDDIGREGMRVARCTVERLMKKLGIQGARRGKKCSIADYLPDGQQK